MFPTRTAGPACPEEINDAIRSFLAERSSRALTGAERQEYARLRTEWLAATRGRGRYCTAA
ncbi:hypothetical protein [Streptomyces sp. I05A-00742]|uniref:hypothetical protein n=1 Tax=Streptomyces sp. I05A-00742 TaxID=2732853 RepID=UPI001487DD00|nr:hypothetical protein [Streptomyces sp. I05A-00742]